MKARETLDTIMVGLMGSTSLFNILASYNLCLNKEYKYALITLGIGIFSAIGAAKFLEDAIAYNIKDYLPKK